MRYTVLSLMHVCYLFSVYNIFVKYNLVPLHRSEFKNKIKRGVLQTEHIPTVPFNKQKVALPDTDGSSEDGLSPKLGELSNGTE